MQLAVSAGLADERLAELLECLNDFTWCVAADESAYWISAARRCMILVPYCNGVFKVSD